MPRNQSMTQASMSTACRRSRSQSTVASPTNPSAKRSFSTATSPRAMASRGKRARRDSSSLLKAQSIMIPVASSSFDPLSGLSTAKPPAVLSTLASSAPPTPLFPSTSAVFFPASHPSNLRNQRNMYMQSASLVSPHTNVNVDDLHREAFSSLRQSVTESGEGFIRRMREWEQQRHTESTKSSILGMDKERDKRRDRDRGRSRRGRSFRIDHRTIGNHSSSNSRAESRQLPNKHLGDDESAGRCALYGHGDTDDEENILLDDSTQMAFGVEHRQRKRRAVSLGDRMDVTNSPELFDVEIAGSDEESYPASRLIRTFDFPFTYSTTRSSSPISFINTSDDESSYVHSGFSSPRGMHGLMDWARSSNSSHPLLGFQRLQVPENVDYDSAETSPLSASPKSTSTRYSLSSGVPSISQTIPCSTPGSFHTGSDRPPQTASEKAVAALTLALANGSGSLADYGSVREAQGNLEELEAGALWD